MRSVAQPGPLLGDISERGGSLLGAMGTFNPAEFAAQCQVPQSQLADLSQDDSGWPPQVYAETNRMPANVGFGMR